MPTIVKVTSGCLIWLLFHITAFGAEEKKPGWIASAKDPAYPISSFYLGVGSGGSARAAQMDATTAISRQLESRVKNRSSLVESGNTPFFASRTTIETDSYLTGLEYVRQWVSDSGQTYVLAALGKSTYKRSLRAAIEGGEKDLAMLFTSCQKYGQEGNKSQFFIFSLKFIHLYKNYQLSSERWRGLGGAAKLVDESPTFSTYYGEVKKGLSSLSFAVQAKGKGASEIAEQAARRFLVLGLQQGAISTSDFTLTITGEADVKKSSTLFFAKGNYQISMADNAKNQFFFKTAISADGGGIKEKAAIDALANDAGASLDNSLVAQLLE